MDTIANIVLRCGDMIVDPDYYESGLLVMRFDVMAAYGSYNEDIHEPVWAWDILWSGSRYTNSSMYRRTAYTEGGLINMIESGAFIHIKNS